MFRKTPLLLSAALWVLLLTACGSGATSSTAPSGAARSGFAAAPAPNGASAGASDSAAAQKAQATAPNAAPQNGAALPAATVPEGPRVQRSASIALEVANGHFDSALDDVIAVAEAAGGYISGQDARAASDGQPLRSGQVTFQVPAGKFESVVTDIRKKGRARSISISGNDVSQQYVDLQARLRNAQAQRDAMLALMQQAKTVNDTIQVENQLGQIQGQIEQLQGQIDYLDHSTTFATVAVTISEEAAVAATDDWGVRTAASQAMHNFVGVVAFLVLALGTLLPLLVVAAGVGWAARTVWRRRGRRLVTASSE